MDDRPLHRPYARIELERRFLVEALPAQVAAGEYEELRDLFVFETHLRVREVYSASGQWLATKLGQKIPNPAAPDDPRQRQMTTIYLPRSEAAALEPLAGVRTVKRRYKLREQGWTWCIDVWQHPAGAAGTMIAEVETTTLAELEALRMPAWAAREVTDDAKYSARTLAAL